MHPGMLNLSMSEESLKKLQLSSKIGLVLQTGNVFVSVYKFGGVRWYSMFPYEETLHDGIPTANFLNSNKPLGQNKEPMKFKDLKIKMKLINSI